MTDLWTEAQFRPGESDAERTLRILEAALRRQQWRERNWYRAAVVWPARTRP